MKLSDKGIENLVGFGFVHNCDGAFSLLDDYEFDQDDFEGTVCLTVEEAKQIFKIIEDFAPIACWAKYEKAIEKLASQIEQAEKGNETK